MSSTRSPPTRATVRAAGTISITGSFGDYLGIGAGAHGKLTSALPDGVVQNREAPPAARTTSRGLRAAAATRAAPASVSASRVPRRDLPFEFMLNALRLNEGFAPSDFEARTGLPASAVEPALRARSRAQLGRAQRRWVGGASELGRRFLNDLQGSFL